MAIVQLERQVTCNDLVSLPISHFAIVPKTKLKNWLECCRPFLTSQLDGLLLRAKQRFRIYVKSAVKFTVPASVLRLTDSLNVA